MAPTKVMVEGPSSSPARVSSAMSAAAARVLAEPLVTAAMVGRAPAGSRSMRRTSSALSPDWLTQTSSESGCSSGIRKCSSSAVSSIEQGRPCPARAVTIG